MEMKLGQVTHDEAAKANNAHYDANNQIMDHIKNMTLAGKRKLIEKLPDHVKTAESDAKGN